MEGYHAIMKILSVNLQKFHSFNLAFIFPFNNQRNRFNLNITGIQPVCPGVGNSKMFNDVVQIHGDPFFKLKSLILIVYTMNNDKAEITGNVVLAQRRVPAD